MVLGGLDFKIPGLNRGPLGGAGGGGGGVRDGGGRAVFFLTTVRNILN